MPKGSDIPALAFVALSINDLPRPVWALRATNTPDPSNHGSCNSMPTDLPPRFLGAARDGRELNPNAHLLASCNIPTSFSLRRNSGARARPQVPLSTLPFQFFGFFSLPSTTRRTRQIFQFFALLCSIFLIAIIALYTRPQATRRVHLLCSNFHLP